MSSLAPTSVVSREDKKYCAPVSPILADRTIVDSVYEGQYDIGKELARGAFGVVHEASHILTGSKVSSIQ